MLGFSALMHAKSLARFGMGPRSKPKRRLLEAYEPVGFRARAVVREAEDDRGTLIISLDRRSKKHIAAAAAKPAGAGTTAGAGGSAIWGAAAIGWFWSSTRGVWTALTAVE